MAMRSYVISSTITIRDKEGLFAWLCEKDAPTYIPDNFRDSPHHYITAIKNSYNEWRTHIYGCVMNEWNTHDNELQKELDEEQVCGGAWLEDCKIIGYWYAGFCAMLRDIAQFIDGQVELQYEEPQTFAQITFENGSAYVAESEISYCEKMLVDKICNLPPLPQKELLVRRL